MRKSTQILGLVAILAISACASDPSAKYDPSVIIGRWGIDQMSISGVAIKDIPGLTKPAEVGTWGWVELKPDGTLNGETPSNTFSGHFTFDGIHFWGSDVWFTFDLKEVPGIPLEDITEAERLASKPFADERFTVTFEADGAAMELLRNEYAYRLIRVEAN